MKTAIIVDDIATYSDIAESYLEDDFTVLKADGIDKALELADSHDIDLAVIDIRLDENDPANKDGIVLVKKLREKSPEAALIVMSAYKEFDYAVEALNAGADYFMKKPLQPDELEKIVAKLCRERK